MKQSTRWPRRFLYLLAVAAGLGSAGCGGETSGPPADSDEFREAKEEREQVIQKEYGGNAPARPKAKR